MNSRQQQLHLQANKKGNRSDKHRSEPIRLLTIITKLELGGAQQVVLNTLAKLPPTRFKKYLLSGSGGYLDEKAKSLEHVQVQLWPALKHPISPFWDVMVFFRLVRFMRRERIQIVHTHSSKAGIIGRLAAAWAGVPAIYHTVHGWPFHAYQSRWLRAVYIWLERLAARFTTKIIAVSNPTASKGLSCRIGQAAQYTVIYPGSDLKEFRPGKLRMRQEPRKEFDFPKEALVVGMVACLKPQKAPLDFVLAAKRVLETLPQSRFLIIGDGPMRAEVQKKILDLQLADKIKLAGWREDVPRLMRGFDLLALSSLWEGLPCVFAQAFASLVPVVATNVEGAREIILSGKTGVLVPPAEPTTLACAIIDLLQNPKKRRQLAKQAKPETRKFELKTMVNQISALYAQNYAELSRAPQVSRKASLHKEAARK